MVWAIKHAYRSRTDNPLDNKSLTPKIAYPPDVQNDTNDEKNITLRLLRHLLRSVSEITEKEFTHKKYRNSTELSKCIW